MSYRCLSLVFLASSLGCVGTTGSSLFTFDAAAAGPEDATKGELEFASPRGFDVALKHARMYVGAAYLDSAIPISGAGNTNCIQPNIEDALVYVGEVTNGLEVDLLDPTPQPFPGRGEAIGNPALAGEVWLTDGDVNAPDSSAVILYMRGTATRSGEEYPFEANFTIGQNRLSPVVNPAEPSANPICKERIVAPIPFDRRLMPTEGGSLLLRIDPREMLTDVDFSEITEVSKRPLLYHFGNDSETADPPSLSLYRGLHSDLAYQFTWNP